MTAQQVQAHAEAWRAKGVGARVNGLEKDGSDGLRTMRLLTDSVSAGAAARNRDAPTTRRSPLTLAARK